MVDVVDMKLSQDIFIAYLSNYSAHAIEIEGILYPTVEHAYHSLRYDDQKIQQEIIQARSPFLAWQISQKYKDQQKKDFVENKLQVMEDLLRIKVSQHIDVKQVLSESGNIQIVKHITTGPAADGFWDDGVDGLGENHIGKLWMKIREELK